MKLTVGVTGASGSIYAKRFIKKAVNRGFVINLVFTDNAYKVWEWEIGGMPDFAEFGEKVKLYLNDDFFVPIASGSAADDAMVVIPCSMGTLGKIANGIADNLLVRAADVILKERKTLILVVREAPYNSVHLENMLKLSRLGVIIFPASPSFYSKPETIDDIVDNMVERIFKLLGQKFLGEKWGGNS